MDRRKLKSVIDQKRERNKHLNVQINYLQIVEEELSYNKFVRFFSTTYLIIKRFILITASLFLIIAGLITYINPDWVYENTKIDELLVADTEKHYKDVAGETFKDSLINLSTSNSEITPNSIFESLEYGFNKAIENEVHEIIISFGILSIFIGFLLLYISRLTRKLRARNKQIAIAEEKTSTVLNEFKNIFNSEECELQNLEDIYDHNIVGEQQRN